MTIKDLQPGDKFTIERSGFVWTLHSLDGEYGFAFNSQGYPLYWRGPVKKV